MSRPVASVTGMMLVGLTGFHLASCSEVTIHDHAVLAVVRGTVLDDEGSGVEGAGVTVRAYRDVGCSGPVWHDGGASSTKSDGSYLDVMYVPLSQPFRACLVVSVAPPATATLQPKAVAGVFIDFVRDGQAPDTATVDVVLTAP